MRRKKNGTKYSLPNVSSAQQHIIGCDKSIMLEVNLVECMTWCMYTRARKRWMTRGERNNKKMTRRKYGMNRAKTTADA